MPEHTLEERLKNARRKSVDAIAANDAAEQATARAPGAKAKPKPKEKVGTGTPSVNTDALIAGLKAKQAATKDPVLKAKLAERIKAIRANTGQ